MLSDKNTWLVKKLLKYGTQITILEGPYNLVSDASNNLKQKMYLKIKN